MEFLAELFVEIFVAGILFAVGISPLIIWLSPRKPNTEDLFPGLSKWSEWQPWIIIAVALVYALGVGGNRLAEQLFQAIGAGLNDLRNAEWCMRLHGDAAREWVERHKSYLKVLRAASLSSLLFFLSAWAYSKYGQKRRYVAKHFFGAAVLFIFFSIGFGFERYHYTKDLSERYLDVKECKEVRASSPDKK
jgi:hypothetical protein